MTKRGFDCGGCERHNIVDNMMLCEKCKKWYHYGCVGVTMMAKYWCNLCVMKVAKCEAQEMMGHLQSSKEAIAKTGMPAESCEGDRRAKRAAHSEGEASANKLSAEEKAPTTFHAARRPPTTNASIPALRKRSKQVALEKLIEVQKLEREIVMKEFEIKMANLKFEYEKIRLQLEDKRRSKRSVVNKTSNTKHSEHDQKHQRSETTSAVRVSESAYIVRWQDGVEASAIKAGIRP